MSPGTLAKDTDRDPSSLFVDKSQWVTAPHDQPLDFIEFAFKSRSFRKHFQEKVKSDFRNGLPIFRRGSKLHCGINQKFPRLGVCSVSATIGIDRSIFDIRRNEPLSA
jgi:hypothetical protein